MWFVFGSFSWSLLGFKEASKRMRIFWVQRFSEGGREYREFAEGLIVIGRGDL